MYQDYLSDKQKTLIQKSAKDGLWSPDYFICDQLGIKEVHCMRCGTPVIDRGRRLQNFRQVRKYLEDNSYVEIMVCGDCVTLTANSTKEENERIVAQIRVGWILEMEHIGTSNVLISERVSTWEKMRIKS